MGCNYSVFGQGTLCSHDSHGFPDWNIKLFTYEEIQCATDNFHPSNKIGQGGFGTVFKGILKNGTPIAAKVLSAFSKQGLNEFLTEINIIRNVKHPNLVELIGCCVEESSRIIVYEFVENNSLGRALLGKNRDPMFDWNKRSAICIGIAEGLTFLHEEVVPHIVHRDIKASNILLDGNFVPKIGDFGLAKLFPDSITHISTRVAGTTGYLAPEYVLRGRLTKSADVYSFGVLILEIISGRRVCRAINSGSEKFLLEQAWQFYEEGRLIELVDPSLKEYPEEEVLKYIKIALFCTQGISDRRPSMPQVREMLCNRIRLNEKQLAPPGLLAFRDHTSSSSSSSEVKFLPSDTSIQQSRASISFSEFHPR